MRLDGVVLQSDGEPAILQLARRVKALEISNVKRRCSPRDTLESNGSAEKAGTWIDAQVRAQIATVENKLGFRVERGSCLHSWAEYYVPAPARSTSSCVFAVWCQHPAEADAEGLPPMRQRVEVIDDDATPAVLNSVADSGSEPSPDFMSAPFTYEELVAGMQRELDQLDHFGRIKTIFASDAS